MKLEVEDIKMDSEAGISFGPRQPSTDPHTLTTSEHVVRRRAEEGVSIGLIASIVASVGILGSWVVTALVAQGMLNTLRPGHLGARVGQLRRALVAHAPSKAAARSRGLEG